MIKMNKLVSVVITTHCRHEDILKRAIESVFNQTYKNIELIVVDDSPNYERHSNVEELINQYGNRLKYIINDIRPSACVSRNIGINNSNGEILALLDDDDEWLPEKLEKMVPYINDQTALVYADFVMVGTKEELYKRSVFEGDVFSKLLELGNFVGGCSVPIMDIKKVMAVGCFDENLNSAQDYDLWLRLSKYSLIKYISFPCVNYYISNDAISSSPSKRLKSNKYLLKKYAEDFTKYPAAKNRVVFDVVYYLYLNGEFSMASDFKKEYNLKISFLIEMKMIIKSQIKRLLLLLKIKNR